MSSSESAADNGSKKIVLRSSDGEIFEVEEAVALESQTIKHIIEDGCADNVIPIVNVTGVILSKVIEFCKRRVDACALASASKTDGKPSPTAVSEEEIKVLFKDDQVMLLDLIKAASYLNIEYLTFQTAADMIKGKSPEEVRKLFNLENDYTPEEEEEVRKQNQWAFD
ncbi:hypothetical protein CASFOL_021380 [Castilleja foliolosa]|uniref:SKP1-like protein n=1 Tax=Castilleja foliolosa TaxID=1961234 RepID=A0ABD3CWE0_9LAMI